MSSLPLSQSPTFLALTNRVTTAEKTLSGLPLQFSGVEAQIIANNIAAMMAALDEAGTTAVVPTQVETIFTPSTGATPVRGSPYLWTQSRTLDRNVMNGSEYAEWIDCLSSTGLERKIAFAATQFGGIINPALPPYNVVYDFKKVKGIQTTVGSNVIASSTATFNSSDIGKLAAVGGATSAGVLVAYIGAVPDSKHIQLFTDLTFTTPANATVAQGSEEMVWGTDNTVGLQAAFDAAEPRNVTSPGGVVLLGGIALTRALQFGSISIIGLSDTGCGLASLPMPSTTAAMLSDKTTGTYATLRADGYTLKNLTLYGQWYTQYYSSFRRNLEIHGGLFANFRRGAPYARIENIDCFEAQYDGIYTAGAFAGQFNNIRSMNNSQVGMRMGFWDLNGQNWHVEANGACGVFSTMPGANVSTVRASYNGASGGSSGLAGGSHPHEYGANYTEAGTGNTISNLRMQESWGDSLCFTGTDPLNTSNGGGAGNSFQIGTFDDTGNMVPAHGVSASGLPGVRAMVYMKGSTVINNTVNLVTGGPHVVTTNYATNAYGDEGNPSNNVVTIATPGISNSASSYYSGNGATAPGPTETTSSSSIATRGNAVTINGQAAS